MWRKLSPIVGIWQIFRRIFLILPHLLSKLASWRKLENNIAPFGMNIVSNAKDLVEFLQSDKAANIRHALSDWIIAVEKPVRLPMW